MEYVSSWQEGTIAQGSSVHAPNTKPRRSYNDSFAIDGNQTTFWNDDTAGSWPDTLIVTTPSTVLLNGIVVLSSQPGWLLDYTVDTPDPNNEWASIARIVNATGPLQVVIFETPVNTSKFRIFSTRAKRDYSRINEIYPIFAVNNVPAAITTSTITTTSSVIITVRKSDTPLSTTPSSDNLCSSSCRTSTTSTFSGKTSEHAASASSASSAPTYSATSTNSSKTVAPAATIASGVFGGLVAILLIAFVTLLLIRRKQKVGATEHEGKDDTGPGDLSNAINAASPMTTRSYHPPHVISAPAPVAYSTYGVNASMSAVLTGPLRPSQPRELDGGFPSSEMG